MGKYTFKMSVLGNRLIVDGTDNYVSLSVHVANTDTAAYQISEQEKRDILFSVVDMQTEIEGKDIIIADLARQIAKLSN